ncbi:MAG TPA: hypothetical protein VGS08_01700 [Candidatus Saccharimonadales bacterium]|nr:hypothetical protein [Candidatus Saccharimonadales bacterium]
MFDLPPSESFPDDPLGRQPALPPEPTTTVDQPGSYSGELNDDTAPVTTEVFSEASPIPERVAPDGEGQILDHDLALGGPGNMLSDEHSRAVDTMAMHEEPAGEVDQPSGSKSFPLNRATDPQPGDIGSGIGGGGNAGGRPPKEGLAGDGDGGDDGREENNSEPTGPEDKTLSPEPNAEARVPDEIEPALEPHPDLLSPDVPSGDKGGDANDGDDEPPMSGGDKRPNMPSGRDLAPDSTAFFTYVNTYGSAKNLQIDVQDSVSEIQVTLEEIRDDTARERYSRSGYLADLFGGMDPECTYWELDSEGSLPAAYALIAQIMKKTSVGGRVIIGDALRPRWGVVSDSQFGIYVFGDRERNKTMRTNPNSVRPKQIG